MYMYIYHAWKKSKNDCNQNFFPFILTYSFGIFWALASATSFQDADYDIYIHIQLGLRAGKSKIML